MMRRRLVDRNVMRGRGRRFLMWIVRPERAAIEAHIEWALGHMLADGYTVRLDWHDGHRVAVIRGHLPERFTRLPDLRTSPDIITEFIDTLGFTLIGPVVIVDDHGHWMQLAITTESIIPSRTHWTLMPWQNPDITDGTLP